jgi:ubiquinone/menaquinone biosynthesis C-methylase UbiE
MTNLKLADLRCPKCLGVLGGGRGDIACTACGQSYRHEGEIPDLRLSRFDYYFNPIPRDKMRALTDAINPLHWPQSVRRFVEAAPNPSWIDNIAVHGRYAWKLLMDLPPGAAVLDIGCGLGGLLSSVAPHVGKAHGIDLTIERLAFSRRRFEVFNREDQTRLVAGGDAAHLPFADGQFDTVFLSGVLEWVGEGDTSGFAQGNKLRRLARMVGAHFGATNPRNIQLGFLREVLRVLKPGGQLYVGIENRLSHEYFGRRRDHHSGLWFGSLMPRSLATLYSILAVRRPYRTYTYSRRGYRRLFAQAGFEAVEVFGFHNGYSDLKSIMPVDAQVGRWDYRPPADAASRWSHRPNFVPAFGIVVSKPGPRGTRLVDRLLDELESRLHGTIRFSTFRIDEHDRAILDGTHGLTPVVLKLPMSVTAEARESCNSQALGLLQQRAALQGLLPRPIAQGQHQRQAYYLETAFDTHAQVPPDSPAIASLVRDARAALERDLWGVGDGPLDRAAFDRLVQPRLCLLCEAVQSSSEVRASSDALWSMLCGGNWRRGAMHGALEVSCLRSAGARLTGIENWHAFDAEGWPALDALLLGWSALQAQDPRCTPERIADALAQGSWRSSAAYPALVGWLDKPELTAVQRQGLALLVWAWWLAERLPSGLQYDPRALRAMVSPLLERLRR